MVVRNSFFVSLAFVSATGFAAAQDGGSRPPVPQAHHHDQAQAPAPKPYELPYIGTVNAKWTLAQNSARLLLEKPVQKELGLSETKRDGLMKVYGDFSSKYQDLTKQDPTKVDIEGEVDKLEAKTTSDVVALLSPAELMRLNQLGVQAMSFNALRLTEVRTALGLSKDQTDTLDKQFSALDATEDALNADLGQQLSQLKDPGLNATTEEQEAYKKAQLDVVNNLSPRGKALDVEREKDFKAFLETLTPAQKAAWESKVRGKTFTA